MFEAGFVSLFCFYGTSLTSVLTVLFVLINMHRNMLPNSNESPRFGKAKLLNIINTFGNPARYILTEKVSTGKGQSARKPEKVCKQSVWLKPEAKIQVISQR